MKITIVGLGIKGCSQLTLEAVAALRTAKSVLVLAGNPVVKGLAELGIPSRSIIALYHDAAVDVANYARVADATIAEAKLKEDVALVIPGHPRVGVTLSSWLDQKLPALGIELAYIPGISSFDTMLVDLTRDPLERGSCILDVNRLLLFDLSLETGIDLYLYHVCSIGNARTDFKDPVARNQAALLQEKLLRTYPATHEVILIGSPQREGGAPTLHRGPVGDLTALLLKVTFSTTLFVPSIRPKKVDRRMLELLQPAASERKNA